MNKQQIIGETVNDFNNTLTTLALNIADTCPGSLIANNISDIQKSINRPQNFTKFIDLFTAKVLIYKSQIDEGNESFFIGKDYKSDLGVKDDSYLNDIISLKSVWLKLSKENQKTVIIYMQILCALSQNYFDCITNENC